MNLALFDFDGTITNREMFGEFLHLAVEPRRLAAGKILLAPLILGYKLGVVPGTHVRAAIVRFAFSGASLAAVDGHGLDFARSVLPSAVRPQAMQRINWHKCRGDAVVVVSGAFDTYLRHWCHAHEVALLCSSLGHKDGELTGRYLGRQCVMEEKARRVREAYDLSSYGRIYAYGDTREDSALLALAHERYYQWQRVSS